MLIRKKNGMEDGGAHWFETLACGVASPVTYDLWHASCHSLQGMRRDGLETMITVHRTLRLSGPGVAGSRQASSAWGLRQDSEEHDWGWTLDMWDLSSLDWTWTWVDHWVHGQCVQPSHFVVCAQPTASWSRSHSDSQPLANHIRSS
jgi:hypothetical protein